MPYAPEVLSFVDAIPLGLVIQSYAVKPAGSTEPLLYWDFKAGVWTRDYSPDCLLLATREAAAGPDLKSQILPIPMGPLATPGAVAKVYAIDPSGARTEVRESLTRCQLAYLAGAAR